MSSAGTLAARSTDHQRCAANVPTTRVRQASRRSRVSFAVGLAAATATQLRAGGVIGLGELILLGWSVATIAQRTWRVERARLTVVMRFNVVTLLSICVGTVVGGLFEQKYAVFLVRNVLAFSLAALCLGAVTFSEHRHDLLMTWQRLWPLMVAAPSLVLFMLSHSRRSFLGLALYSGDYSVYSRFNGWTTNPNQFAFFIGIAMYLAALSAVDDLRALRYIRFVLNASIALCSMYLGLASNSDGFRVALAASLPLVVILSLARTRRTVGGVSRWVLCVLLAIVMVLKLPAAFAQAHAIQEYGGQGSIRTTLWKSCAGVLAKFPFTGIGSGLPAHAYGGRFECHNAYLGLATAGGVAAAAMCLYALGRLALGAARCNPMLFGSLVWLAISMAFNDPVRHTIFWIFLALAAQLLLSGGAPGRSRRGAP